MKSCISNVNEVCVWKCIRWRTAVLSEGFCLTDQPEAVILFRPNCIFMFTKEVQESEVYSDLEKINPIFQNDRPTCGGFCCAENSVLGWISKGKSMPIWNACLQNKTLKNWAMCLLILCNTAKKLFSFKFTNYIYIYINRKRMFLDLYRWYNHLALHIWEQKKVSQG